MALLGETHTHTHTERRCADVLRRSGPLHCAPPQCLPPPHVLQNESTSEWNSTPPLPTNLPFNSAAARSLAHLLARSWSSVSVNTLHYLWLRVRRDQVCRFPEQPCPPAESRTAFQAQPFGLALRWCLQAGHVTLRAQRGAALPGK